MHKQPNSSIYWAIMKRPTWRVNVWSTLNYHQMPWSMLWLVGGDRMDAWIGSFWGPVRRYSIFQGWVSGSSNHQRNYMILDVGKANICNWPSLDVGKCQLLPNMEEKKHPSWPKTTFHAQSEGSFSFQQSIRPSDASDAHFPWFLLHPGHVFWPSHCI